MKHHITVLGSTGSIGVNTLDVVSRHPERFQVFALSASTQVDALLAQCEVFRPVYAVMASETHACLLAQKLKEKSLQTQVIQDLNALEVIASHPDVDMVMAAIVGAAGLRPCMAAAKAGKKILLANKEALVVGASVFMNAVLQGCATLLPIDSEHSAVFQSLPSDPSVWQSQIEKIILTASGGPFRRLPVDQLRYVTPEQACTHPNWSMGRKISVDSATMMNKALEVIEAKYLFGIHQQQIEVVIHPQSIVHSMVQFKDTSVVSQMGTPDMRVPIAYGLSWPDRIESGAKPLDFCNMPAITFESITEHDHPIRFPGLLLAWDALNAPAGTTAVLNAANEMAVSAFLAGQIRFDQIFDVNRATLDAVSVSHPNSMEALIDLDKQSRAYASEIIYQTKR